MGVRVLQLDLKREAGLGPPGSDAPIRGSEFVRSRGPPPAARRPVVSQPCTKKSQAEHKKA